MLKNIFKFARKCHVSKYGMGFRVNSLLLLAALVSSPPLIAQGAEKANPKATAAAQKTEPGKVEYGRDLDSIVKRGVLRVAVPNFQAPPFFVEQDGVLSGFDIDLAQRLAKSMGIEVQFNRAAQTFNDAVAEVVEGRADIAICKLSRTMGRASKVLFSNPYLEMRHALAINRLSFARIAKGREVAAVARSFSGKIGVIGNSSYEEYARKHFPDANVLGFKDWDSAVGELREGSIDALYRDELEIKRLIRLDPVFPLLVRTVTLKDTYDSIGAAMPLGAFHLLSFVNLFIAQNSHDTTVDTLLKSEKAEKQDKK